MKKLPLSINLVASAGLMVTASCATETPEHAHQTEASHTIRRPGLTLVDYRSLNGGKDGIAIVDLDPDSSYFGNITDKLDIGVGVLTHHPYFNRDESKLYTTALGGSFLYEVDLDYDWYGQPWLDNWYRPINTGTSKVGEDMYFTRDGSRYYMTFMNGNGSIDGGSVGVFDAATDELIETIEAVKPADPNSTAPFIMYPHGISADEDRGVLMVTSTIHPDGASGVGNTLTTIDLNTNTPIKTQLAAESASDLSSPIEVILLRDDLPPYALTTTEFGNDIWAAPFDAASGTYGQFVKAVEGETRGLSLPLEFYINTNGQGVKELFVSYGIPGVVEVYALDSLPALPLKRSFATGAGAHHMVFFRTKYGREVVAVQNNLLNIAGLNAGTITVHDLYTGALLGTVNLPSSNNLMPESIEWAYGHGSAIHH